MPSPDDHHVYSSRLIPARAGIGLRAQHYQDILNHKPDIGWLEVHTENYFGAGGKPHYYLEKIRQDYPLSLHGVGLSLGSTDPINIQHLEKLKHLIQRYQPGLVSEHLSWGSIQQRYLNDLLPFPYRAEILNHMVDRISRVQEIIGTPLLVENISSYIQFNVSDMTEWDFISETARRSGCGILLDINNVYVNSRNHGFDPVEYINHIPVEHVQEIHLAGHTVKHFQETDILIDSHDQPVCSEVWELYKFALLRFPSTPVLIEWDSDIPPLPILLNEARKAQQLMQGNFFGEKHVQPEAMAI